jgi:dephospho-CoA kinase
MVIGITGGIGSGKSSFVQLLAARGAKVIDADKVGHQVIEGEGVRRELVRAFGEEIVDERGKLKRSKLGEKAFSSQENLKLLNDIVHPPLFEELKHQIKEAVEDGQGHIVAVDAALLFEWGELGLFDRVVVIEASQEIRQQRVMARSGLSAQQVQQRMAAQLSSGEKVARADVVVDNNSNLETLERQATSLWRQWTCNGNG